MVNKTCSTCAFLNGANQKDNINQCDTQHLFPNDPAHSTCDNWRQSPAKAPVKPSVVEATVIEEPKEEPEKEFHYPSRSEVSKKRK
jgi:hypothetical protein